MKYLLDTHALLWYLFDSENLSQTAKEIINNEFCYYSKVSLWEIAIKQSGNKYNPHRLQVWYRGGTFYQYSNTSDWIYSRKRIFDKPT